MLSEEKQKPNRHGIAARKSLVTKTTMHPKHLQVIKHRRTADNTVELH